MKLVSLTKIEQLEKQEPVQDKHWRFFQDNTVFSYPEVWYRGWLGGLKNYLVQRQQRSSK